MLTDSSLKVEIVKKDKDLVKKDKDHENLFRNILKGKFRPP